MILAAGLAVLSALLYGMSDFSSGLASRSMRVVPATTLTYGVAAGVLLISLVVTGGRWSAGAVFWGCAAGTFAIVGLVTFYAAMVAGPMSVASPLIAVLEASVPVVVGVAVGDHLVWWSWLAICTAGAAAVLIAADRSGDSIRVSPRTLVLAIVSGGALGLSVVTLDTAPTDARLIPGVVEILVGLLALVGFGALSRASSGIRMMQQCILDAGDTTGRPGRRATSLAALGGLLLGGANVLLIVALHSGNLAIVGILVSLYPAATIVLARLVLNERLAPPQIVGVALALVAAAALALT